MNRAYRIVFNAAKGILQVASELTRGRGKQPGQRTRPMTARRGALRRRPIVEAMSLALAVGFGMTPAPSNASCTLSTSPTSTVNNSGTCTVSGNNYGTLNNLSGASLYFPSLHTVKNYGTINNEAGATLTDSAAELDNVGTLNNAGSMTVNFPSGFFSPSTILDASLSNQGILNNTGTLTLGTYSSYSFVGGTLNNHGVWNIDDHFRFLPTTPYGSTNSSYEFGFGYTAADSSTTAGAGVENLYANGTLNIGNNSAITSVAVVNAIGHTQLNAGIMNIGTDSELYNHGTWDNTGTMNINGVFTPHDWANSNYSIDGALDNSGTINNHGSLTLNYGNNNLGAGTINNYGSLTITLPSFNTVVNVATYGAFTHFTMKPGSSLNVQKMYNPLGHTQSSFASGAVSAYHIENWGTWDVGAGGSLTSIIQNYGTLNNAGTLTLSQSVLESMSMGVLNNSGTLNANGTLNLPAGLLNNTGTLDVKYYGGLYASGTVQNDGTASIDGALTLKGSLINNGTMTLDVFQNYAIDTGSRLINNGTLNLRQNLSFYQKLRFTDWMIGGYYSVGTDNNYGTVYLNSGSTLNNYATLTNPAGHTQLNAGALNDLSGATLVNAGTLNNTGSLTLTSGSNYDFTGGTLNNAGTLNLQRNLTFGATTAGTLNLNAGSTLNNYATLTNPSGHAQINAGTLANKAGAALNNYSALTNQSGGTLSNAGTLTNKAGGTLNNAGTLTNQSGGTLVNQSGASLNNTGTITDNGTGTVQNDGAITNTGTFTVSAADPVTGTGTFTQSAGTTAVNGTFAQTSMAILGGRLEGTGTLNVTNPIVIGTGAIIDPGAAPGEVGTLTSSGTIDISGTLNIDLASLSSFDQLNVTGAGSQIVFEQGSAINFMLDGSFMPTTGNTFDFLSAAGGVSGLGNVTYGFTDMMGMPAPSGLSGTLAETNGDSLQLEVTSTPAAVPLPAAGWLFLSGLIGLVGLGRRQS